MTSPTSTSDLNQSQRYTFKVQASRIAWNVTAMSVGAMDIESIVSDEDSNSSSLWMSSRLINSGVDNGRVGSTAVNI